MVKVRSIIMLLVGFCFLLDNGVSYVPFIGSIGRGSPTTSFVIPVLLFLWCRFGKTIAPRIKHCCKFIDGFVSVIFIFVVIEAFYSLEICHYSLESVAEAAKVYAKLLLIYPLLYLFISSGEKKVTRMVYATVGLLLLYFVLVSIVYNITGVNLCPSLIKNASYSRTFGIRIRSFPLFWVITLISFAKFLSIDNKGEKFKSLFFFAVSLTYIITINQSRAQDVAVVAMIVGMYFFNKRTSRSQLLLVCVGLVCSVVIFNSTMFQSFLYSFSPESIDNTTQIRFVIIDNLYNAVKQLPAGFWLGYGMQNTAAIGDKTRYFMDIGLLGDFFNTGIMSLILFFGVFLRLLSNAKECYKVDSYGYLISVGCLIMLIGGIPGFTLQPSIRFMAFPVIIAYSEFLRMRVGTNEVG